MMTTKLRGLLPILLALALWVPFPTAPGTSLRAQEVIHNFTTQLEVLPDGSIVATETILITTTGEHIKRGITRAIALSPIGDSHQSRLSYEALSVKRNGQPISHFEKMVDGNQVFYLGSKNELLDPGDYTYEFIYRSDDQIYITSECEEVRWHLIDTDTKLTVKAADIRITFPPGTRISRAECFAGAAKSMNQFCSIDSSAHSVYYTLARPLDPGEGMTVVAGVPSGTFPHLAHLASSTHTPAQRFNPNASDSGELQPQEQAPPNKYSLYAIIFGLLIALGYAYTSWNRHGRDPIVKVDQYEFHPPDELSPAAVAYLNSNFQEQLPFLASLTALITKGYIEVSEKTSKGLLGFGNTDFFVLRHTNRPPLPEDLPAEQYLLAITLFAESPTLELDGNYNKTLVKIQRDHAKLLQEQFREFKRDGNNGRHLWPLIGILVLSLAIALFFVQGGGQTAIISLLIGTPLFLIGLAIYDRLIRQPSPGKVKLLNRIKAFHKFLKLPRSESERTLNAPELTRDYYDRTLPYAVGLGVQNDWAEALSHDLANSSRQSQHATLVYLTPLFSSRLQDSYATSTTTPGGSGSVSSVGGGGGGTGGF